MTTITLRTRRRFIMGLQGLYPGRRWRGKAGIVEAIEALGGLQLDPLNVIARSHELALHARVLDIYPGDLEAVCYEERRFFDYGGGLFLHPMAELPYWRIVMERRREHPRYLQLIAEFPTLLDEVLAHIRANGETTSRALDTGEKRAASFRSGKVTGQALYHLWLTGELMTARRQGNFERVFDLRERVAPPAYQYAASVEEAEEFFSRNVLVPVGMATASRWRLGFMGFIERRVTQAEADARLEGLIASGEVVAVRVEGEKQLHYVRNEDFPLLETLHAGETPAAWQPLETTTTDEMLFLAPLDMVSARGRAKPLFGFEYIWEVYKPVEKRQFGYYTLPILYGDSLVGRVDPRLERSTKTLQILGLWWEPGIDARAAPVRAAFRRAIERLMRFLNAEAYTLPDGA